MFAGALLLIAIWILTGPIFHFSDTWQLVINTGLKLIAANPASPFANFIYQMTELFLAPFAGLTVSPAAEGAVLEIPALIGMVAYAVLYWLILRFMWVIFDKAKARDAGNTSRMFNDHHAEKRSTTWKRIALRP